MSFSTAFASVEMEFFFFLMNISLKPLQELKNSHCGHRLWKGCQCLSIVIFILSILKLPMKTGSHIKAFAYSAFAVTKGRLTTTGQGRL